LFFEVTGEMKEKLAALPAVIVVDPNDTGLKNRSTYLLPPLEYPDGKTYLKIGPGMQPLVKVMNF
jgi:sarcosine oxidase